MAALIYYVRHVAASLQVSEIARAVVLDLQKSIDALYPEHIGDDGGPPEVQPATSRAAVEILSTSSGYVQRVEAGQVINLAKKAGVVVWLSIRPGDFVTEGLPIAAVHPAFPDRELFRRTLNDALVLGRNRTADQDAGFPMQQLVEVTLHALSTE